MIRFLFSISSFAATMILGLVAFAYTALNHPATMREMISMADGIRRHFSVLGLSDNYMVWFDILLQSNQIVLVGFTIFIRLIIEIFGTVFGGGSNQGDQGAPASSSKTSNSPFSRWG